MERPGRAGLKRHSESLPVCLALCPEPGQGLIRIDMVGRWGREWVPQGLLLTASAQPGLIFLQGELEQEIGQGPPSLGQASMATWRFFLGSSCYHWCLVRSSA